MKIEPGMLIMVGNDSFIYRVVDGKYGCTCSLPLDNYNMSDPPATEPHMHLTVSRPDGSGRFWFGWFRDSDGRSLEPTYVGKRELDYDYIQIMPCDKPVQMHLL